MSTLLWTFPLLLTASIVIGWAAELMAIHLSAGMALAVLAWLQTSPEFAVEATIAWNREAHLALANLTGSLRLLLGVGWPMVFLVYMLAQYRKREKNGGAWEANARAIRLPESFSVEAVGLVIPLLYFLVIYFKRTWSALDGLVLCSFYGIYFWMLNLQRRYSAKNQKNAELHLAETEEPWVVRKIKKKGKRTQYAALAAMFFFGTVALLVSVHPFVEGLKSAALSLGVSEFVFIQWIAPLASEFPEKVTAFNWARKPNRASFALVNMVSSVTSQWTLLAGLVPLIFSWSAGEFSTIQLSEFQRTELLITVAQSALAVAFMVDLKIKAIESFGLLLLWFVQFFVPLAYHDVLAWIYAAWALLEAIRLARRPSLESWDALKKMLRAPDKI